MRTLAEVDNYIEELEENISFMERCYFSNDILIGNMIDLKDLEKAEEELKFYERISSKLFNKILRSN